MSAIFRSSSTTRIVGRWPLLHASPFLIVPMSPPRTSPAPAASEEQKEEEEEEQRSEPESPRPVPAIRIRIRISGRARRRLKGSHGCAMGHAGVVREESGGDRDERRHSEEPPTGTIGILTHTASMRGV